MSPFSRTIAALYGTVVVNTSYRLAPKYKFPTAAQDTFDILHCIIQNADTLCADPTKGFVLTGGSAGGNLAAVTAQKWRSTGASPPLTGVSLMVPWLLAPEIVPEEYKELWFSREQNADAMLLDKQAMDHMFASYEPDVRSSDFSPFNAKAPHEGLPPVHIQVCGSDPLRDDGMVYEKALRAHGVKTRLDVYPGVPHGFHVFPGLELAKTAFVDTVLGIGWLLVNEKSAEDVRKILPDRDWRKA
ncbi:hypothetical protein DL769_011572 [Monosporascus sp. CRB-8-3]|nr:hypothetical protein DL769_011572 [Monosporascus sp. CRB-8-3]